MASTQNQGQQYKITDAVITADRLGDLEIEITRHIAELNVFEHLEKPYLTGQLMVVDDNSIFSSINFKGTERFSFKVASVEEGVNVEFEHTFIMKSIEKVERTTDKTSVYLFSLIDEHAFRDAAIRFSKSYTGKLERIATGVIVSELGVDVDISYAKEISVQPPMRIIVPYMSPLTASKWLLDRASTVSGAPYYIYASMYDDNIRIGDLETMLAQEPFNSQLPYIYSAASTSSVVDYGEDKKAFIVQDLRTERLEETMKMTFDGAIGAQLTTQDISGSTSTPVHHSVRDTIQRLRDNGIIPQNAQQQVFDPEYLVEEDTNNPVYLDDLDARLFHTITSYGTYNKQRSYHDAFNRAEALQRLQSNSIRSMIERNRIEVFVPGTGLFLRKVTVGDTVSINFLSSDTTVDQSNEDEKYDKQKSGNYLIYSIRHTFKDRLHNASMTVTKINTQNRLKV